MAKPPQADSDTRFAKLLAALGKDPLFAPVLAAYAEGREVGGRRFGSNGLKVNSKLFALHTQGTLVVKLPRARVSELVAAGKGTHFDPGHGRLMKEWLTVTDPRASWAALAKEAHAYVGGAKR